MQSIINNEVGGIAQLVSRVMLGTRFESWLGHNLGQTSA